MSDAYANDRAHVFHSWSAQGALHPTVVAGAAGSGADSNLLKQITENVVTLDTADSQSIAKFFNWVSASIGVTSTKVEDAGKEVTGLGELPPPPSEMNIVV